jgi:hypothetical protein
MEDELERDVHRRFQALRAIVARETPPFAVPSSRPRRALSGVRVLLATACCLALALIGALLTGRWAQSPPGEVASYSGSGWRAPTDFLLRTPGAVLLTLPPEWSASSTSSMATERSPEQGGER